MRSAPPRQSDAEYSFGEQPIYTVIGGSTEDLLSPLLLTVTESSVRSVDSITQTIPEILDIANTPAHVGGGPPRQMRFRT